MATHPAALAKSGKFGDLKRRLWFLLLALVVYRIGAHIPVPGIDPDQLAQLFKGQLDMDDLGFLKVNEKMETSVHGVFAAGEAADPHFRQVVTSAGMGAAAAIQATRYLEETEAG